MTRKFVYLAGGAIVGVSAAHAPVFAQEVRTELNTSASVGYQSNPFLEAAGANAGISTTIEIDPRVYLEDENSLISITGNARFDYFPEDGRSNDAFRIAAAVSQRANERLDLNAGAVFRTSRNALLDAIFSDPAALGQDATLPEPVIIDPTLAGRRLRSTNYGVNAGASLRVSPVSTLSANLSSNWSEFDGGFGNDFATTSGEIQYGRALSETTTLGVVGAISYTTFDGNSDATNPFLALDGRSTVIDGRATYETSLSPTGRISLQLGLSFIDFDLGNLGSEKSTIVSGSASFCEEALGGSFCLNGSRTAQPTALGGISTLSSVGAGWTTQLSARDTLSLGARYSWVDVPNFSLQELLPVQRDSRIFGLSSSYRRDIGRDFSFFVTGNYSEGSGGVGNLPSNYGGRAGISKKFGGAR